MARVKTFTNGGRLFPADLNAIQDEYDSRLAALEGLLVVPQVRVHMSTSPVVNLPGPGNWLTVPWNVVDYDLASPSSAHFDAATPTVLTCRLSGLYEVGTSIHMNPRDGIRRQLRLVRGDPAAGGAFIAHDHKIGTVDPTTLQASDRVRLVAGDQVHVEALSVDTSTSFIPDYNDPSTAFWMTYLSA